MQPPVCHLLRASTSSLRPLLLHPTRLAQFPPLLRHQRNMSEIKKVFTQNACPRKLAIAYV